MPNSENARYAATLHAIAATVLTGEPCPDDCGDYCGSISEVEGHDMGGDGEYDALVQAVYAARSSLGLQQTPQG